MSLDREYDTSGPEAAPADDSIVVLLVDDQMMVGEAINFGIDQARSFQLPVSS